MVYHGRIVCMALWAVRTMIRVLHQSFRALPQRYFKRMWIAVGATYVARALVTIDIPGIHLVAHGTPTDPVTCAGTMSALIITDGSLIPR